MTIEAGGRAGHDRSGRNHLRVSCRAPVTRPRATSGTGRWRTGAPCSPTPARLSIAKCISTWPSIAPMVTWGTTPGYACAIDHRVPDPAMQPDPDLRAAMSRALDYMGLAAERGARRRRDRQGIHRLVHQRAHRGYAQRGRGGARPPHCARRRGVGGAGLARGACASRGRRARPRVQGSRTSSGAFPAVRCVSRPTAISPRPASAAPPRRTVISWAVRDPACARILMSPAMAAAAAVTGRLTDVRRLLGA